MKPHQKAIFYAPVTLVLKWYLLLSLRENGFMSP